VVGGARHHRADQGDHARERFSHSLIRPHPAFVLLVVAALVATLIARGKDEGETSQLPATETARVVRAVDGDTILAEVGGERRYVRYIGVDTPETVKEGTPVQCFGPQAHDFNERLVGGRRVRLVLGEERTDKYGRLLAYVYAGGRFVNAELVRRGYARTLTIAPNDRFAPRFARLAERAGRLGRGLWGVC
jgi:micrococcal nuclease